jgi:DNA-binding response OmpR family regulator
MRKILIIEDEEIIRMALVDDFKHEGYLVDYATNGNEGFERGMDTSVDLIILDIMLPEMNGFEVCKRLRMNGVKTPIIMLTAKGQEIDRVVGLELGADDYVTKPFSPRELQARVRAIFRRTENIIGDVDKSIFEFEQLKVDFLQFECYKNGELASLTKHEFDLLKYLIKNRGRVIKRDELLNEVWGDDVIVSSRTIDTHMANLRKKIEEDSSNPKIIKSIRGVGYKIS